jgi:hypothetical protein
VSARLTCPRPKGCGRKFTPRKGTRRVYCYVCRPEKITEGPESVETPPAGVIGALAAAVQAELVRTRESDSVLGAVALRLAHALDDPLLGAAQVSSLSAQLIKIMEPIRTPAARPPDEVDEFTRRLLEKQAQAS